MKQSLRAIIIGLAISTFMTACAAEPTDVDALVEEPRTIQVPDWARANIAYSTAGTGRWVADNAAYKSGTETWDSYVIEWRAGPDNLSMTARMYAMIDGRPSQGDFWSFYQYWDTAKGEMRIIQSGWGVVGDGAMTAGDAPNTFITEQTFTTTEGKANPVRHTMAELSPTQHETTSFNRGDDDDWVQDRRYIWTLES